MLCLDVAKIIFLFICKGNNIHRSINSLYINQFKIISILKIMKSQTQFSSGNKKAEKKKSY